MQNKGHIYFCKERGKGKLTSGLYGKTCISMLKEQGKSGFKDQENQQRVCHVIETRNTFKGEGA